MATVHIVSKDNHADQHLLKVSPNTLPALAPSSSYFPSPFNDSLKYGIVPAWGFATVIESNIADIRPGTLIHGFWPLSTLHVDLQLVPAELSGHWWETSKHRQKMMPLYNRYMIDNRTAQCLADETNPETIELGWDATVRLIWGCGHLLNYFVFPGDSSIKAIHPLGEQLPWSREDADLSLTLLVSLSASTKTGLSLADQLIHNRPKEAGPLGLLAVASKPDQTTLCLDGAPFPTKAVTYSQAINGDTKVWIQNLLGKRPTRALIIDFGGRGDSLKNIHLMFASLGVPVTTLAVGSEAKVYTPRELAESRAEFARLKKIQSNASGQRGAAMAQIGEDKYFGEMFEEWKKFRGRGGFPGMSLNWGDGMIGEKGIEGAWKKLCEGTTSGENGNMVFRL